MPSVYRHFSADGVLLYVGASLNVLQRQVTHSSMSSWFDEVVKITIEKHPTKDAALAAERAAIAVEAPRHNYAGQRQRPSKRLPFKAPVDVIPYQQWDAMEQKRYARLSVNDWLAIRRDRYRNAWFLACEWKLKLNTIYFILEERAP